MKALLVGSLLFCLTACATSGLNPLAVEGHDLHEALVTRHLDNGSVRHVPIAVLHANPQISSETEFVEAIAKSGSQGQLGRAGIRAALYSLYKEESELGFYGLEAASVQVANRLEEALREIWSHNIRIDRARVHRAGKVLLVVWTDGVSAECWEAVNASVIERLSAH